MQHVLLEAGEYLESVECSPKPFLGVKMDSMLHPLVYGQALEFCPALG